MLALIDPRPCPASCGESHGFCVDRGKYSANGTYQAECPVNGKRIVFKPMIAYTPIRRCPAGSIPAERIR